MTRIRGHYDCETWKSKLDVVKHSFSKMTVNEWNELSADCVHSSSVQEQNRQISCDGG